MVALGTVVAAVARALTQERLAGVSPMARVPVAVDRIAAGPEVAAQVARLQAQAWGAGGHGVEDPVARAKARALAVLAQVPLVVRPAAVEVEVAALVAARDVPAVRRAEEAVLRVAQTAHLRVLGEVLAIACGEASIEAGYPTVQIEEIARDAGPLCRVVATDAAGRALVTEIDPGDARRPARIETEVVGVTDGRCLEVLDRFDRALEARGVEGDEAPERRWTGGVGALSLARAFVRRPVGAVVAEPRATAPSRTRRARRPAPKLRDRLR